jgi:hypothetical protein
MIKLSTFMVVYYTMICLVVVSLAKCTIRLCNCDVESFFVGMAFTLIGEYVLMTLGPRLRSACDRFFAWYMR